ncbi:MAG: hypothetical protein WC958_03270 [Dehalococcoidales bacterium]|jgi:hypothetical protein
MASNYKRGQRVVIVPAKDQFVSPYDSRLEPFAGRIGVITDYYRLDLPDGKKKQVFIYTVRMKNEDKEVVVYEDELRAYIGSR